METKTKEICATLCEDMYSWAFPQGEYLRRVFDGWLDRRARLDDETIQTAWALCQEMEKFMIARFHETEKFDFRLWCAIQSGKAVSKKRTKNKK